MCRKRYQPWRSSWTSKLTIKLSRLSSHVEVKACLHGGKEPRVGEATRLGGVARLYLVSLILPWSRLHDRWNNPPRRVSRSAGLGYPVSRGHNLPNVNVSRWGDPISRGRIHVTFASAPTTSRNLTKESRVVRLYVNACYQPLHWDFALVFFMCESFLLPFLTTFASDESVVLGPVLIASKAPVIFKASSGFEGGGIFVSIPTSISFLCIRQ